MQRHTKLLPALVCLGTLTAPAIAATCPTTPGGLPSGKAEWSTKGNPRWFLTTSDKKSYSCEKPIERKEMNIDGIYTDFEYTDFMCAPLKITISKCVMDQGRSYYPKYGLGKDHYTDTCIGLTGSRWRYSLFDKNGERFTLTGPPSFSVWEPSKVERTCASSHVMQERSYWGFKSGAKYIFINKIQGYIATAVKQPAL